MNPLPPVNAVPLFPAERAALLDLLSSLQDEQWELATICPGWSVKDIAAHLAFDDIRRLSDGRDRYKGERFEPSGKREFAVELREFLNTHNEAWVAGARGLSPRVITELLRWSGAETQAYFESVDPDARAHIGVSWAGEVRSANWFDLAREYSERWIHQAQIREAVGAPMLYDDNLFLPLLDTMVRAVPHALRASPVPSDTVIRLAVERSGQILRTYNLMWDGGAWGIFLDPAADPAATVTTDGATAWRLFTKGISKEDALARSTIEGDRGLAGKVFDTVSIIA